MNKDDVVKSLVEMADLLEIVEASRFEVLAFRNAASALDDWPGDLQSTIANGTIEEIPTIGKGTAKVITELTLDSTSEDLENIRSQVPDELPKLLRFRGLGEKKYGFYGTNCK